MRAHPDDDIIRGRRRARFQPLYQQIKAAILQGIESGEWAPGQMIPSEMDLARRFS